MARGFKRRRKKRLRILLVILIIIVVILYDGNTRLVTDSFTIGNGRLPGGFEGFKIVQLSDLHTTRFGDENSRLIDEVSKETPDIIVITGDLIDGDRDDEYIPELMAGLTQIAPVYYVSGNHEWASGWTLDIFDSLRECGVTVLRNEYVVLTLGEDKIILAGVDDPNGPYDMKTPSDVVGEIRQEYEDDYIIMLAHRNSQIETWASLGVDTVLCGHAHGGIVRLPFTDGLIGPGMELFPDYTSGIYTEGGTQMLVSRGLGNSRSSLRVFNNPEIVSVTLTKNS